MPILIRLHRGQEKKADTDANGAIGDVERRKTDLAAAALVNIEAEKIDYMADDDAIDQIPCDSAKNQTQRGLPNKISRIEIISINKQQNQRDRGNDRQHRVVSAKDAPGRAGVAPMHELEKTVENHALISMIIERVINDLFGDLIQENNCDGQQPDSLILSEWHPNNANIIAAERARRKSDWPEKNLQVRPLLSCEWRG